MKNFFSLFWQSISDFNFYKKVINFTASTVFKYFLMLLVIVTLIVSVGTSRKISKFVKETGDWAITNLPVIDITDGKASVDALMPFRVEKEEFTVIIDTTGQTLSIDESVKTGILLTEDKVIYKQSKNQMNSYELSNIKRFTLDKNSIEKWQRSAFRVSFPLVFLISFIYFAVAKIIQILFFSLLPWMVCGINNIEVKYKQVLKISAFALTLAFTIASLVELFGLKVRFFSLLFIFIYAVYLVKGALACKDKMAIEGIK